MKYFELGYREQEYSFAEAVKLGLGPHGNLFMPSSIPQIGAASLQNLPVLKIAEIAYQILRPYVQEDIDDLELKSICAEALNFDIPLVEIDESTYVLEVFHGPTYAFKDVGARFLSRFMSRLTKGAKNTVLVATSGDTGSAVANGFWGVEGVDVIILFPKGGISPFQESQMTTLGGNITAIEVEGVFDDCQRMVKEAFRDQEINQQLNLTSANSINIGRLLPQIIYYFIGWSRIPKLTDITVSVPSGNFGNITAGLMAMKMGLPVEHWVASTNANKVFPDYISTGIYTPAASLRTLSNAMDVGDPSNFQRLLHLFDYNYQDLITSISSYSVSDEQTLKTIKEVQECTGYILDPHTAVGYYALRKARDEKATTNPGMIVSTAHPSKFVDVVKSAVPDYKMELKMDDTKSEKLALKADSKAFKQFLLQR